jgi:prepilin-type N-terminal cleavage/methylation domain-containing protein
MKKNRGYTIIEFLVALSIFVIVIVVVLGLFSMAIKGQRRLIAQQNVQENARYLMEFMAKEIRMSVITSSNGTSGSLSLIRSDGNSVTYNITSGKLYRNDGQTSSDEVIITGNFYVEGFGAGISDNKQPKVTITLGIQGTGNQAEEKSKINIQTTLSQRNLDI